MGIGDWFRWMRPGTQRATSVAVDGQLVETNRGGLGLMRWSSGRQQAMDKLQAGYDRLLGLCETIDTHLQSQREQGQVVADSLSRLTSSIEEVPQMLGRLSDRLDRIAEQAVKTSASTDRLSDAIDQLVPAQRSQNDLLSCVSRQLGESSHTNQQLAEVVVELKGAMQILARSEQERGKVYDGLAQLIQHRDREFTAMIEQHTRAFKLAWVGSLSAAVVAIFIALVAMVR